MTKLSVVIITKNEENFITDAIQSVRFADETLVLDCGSEDGTREIAEQLGARVAHQDWLGFGAQKNKAIALATYDWVFVLDADERVTPELGAEIETILENPAVDGYRVARLNYFFGKLSKTSRLYPDYNIRLFDKTKGAFNDVAVHESVQLKGRVATLKQSMIHLAYDSIDEFITKQNRYSALNAKKNIWKALFNPGWTFFKLYFIKLGFLDGWHGFIIAKLYAQYTFWKYIKCPKK